MLYYLGLPFTAADSGKKKDKQILPKNVETVFKQVQGIAQQQGVHTILKHVYLQSNDNKVQILNTAFFYV